MNHHHWHHHERPGYARAAVHILGAVVLGAALAFGFGWVVKHLWNALMPELFGLKAITYWQGLGLFILAKLFFGGMHHRHWGRHKFRRGCGPRHRCRCGEPEAPGPEGPGQPE